MTLEKLVSNNPSNETILCEFQLIDEELIPFQEVSGNKLTESLSVFWNEYAANVPDNTKYLMGYNGLLVNPQNGEIFAIQFGRFEIAFRYNPARNTFTTGQLEELRVFRNLDGIQVDKRELGNNWVLAIHFVGEVEDQLRFAYEYSMANT